MHLQQTAFVKDLLNILPTLKTYEILEHFCQLQTTLLRFSKFKSISLNFSCQDFQTMSECAARETQ